MKNKAYKEMLTEAEYPELYSKRGFERKRIKIIIQFKFNELAYLRISNGKIIVIP